MAINTDKAPERLRDFTFPVWDTMSWLKHGFLTFLAADSFAKHEAYANHSTFYLLFMRCVSLLQHASSLLTMRVAGAVLAMLSSLVALWFAVRQDVARNKNLRQDALILAAFLYFLTLPSFWISLGKFNVDNAFVFVFPLLLVASVALERSGTASRAFWISAVLMCFLMPMASALFSVFILGMAITVHGGERRRTFASLTLLALSVLLYLQPVIVAKLLGFTTQNSTWLFRSGLDGDMRFYGNFIDSVIAPQFNRPWYFIALPAAVPVLQTVYCRWHAGTTDIADESIARIMFNVFSVYVLMLLLWPQAVSIHPYLYDALLLGPLVTWTLMNFASRAVFQKYFVLWFLLLAFLIQFNLTKIAQAGQCTDCYFPTWGMSGARGG